MAKLGAPLGEVLAAATERPAALLNNEDVGQIRLGARADIVVLDDELAIHEVLLEGRSLL
jgi:N-acetylglucosamine-6-phosphate deacetylase